jgi:hypothetical protein
MPIVGEDQNFGEFCANRSRRLIPCPIRCRVYVESTTICKKIEFPLFDVIDELLDLGRISGGDVIVVFHRRRSRRSYARQKRTPRLGLKYFLFSRGFTAGTRMNSLCRSVVSERDQWINLRCPPRRNPARCKSDEREKDCYCRERQRVGGTHTEQHALESARCDERARESEGRADEYELHPLS